jgi:hypothetical protein
MEDNVIRLVRIIMWFWIIVGNRERAITARDLSHKLTIGHNTETRNR